MPQRRWRSAVSGQLSAISLRAGNHKELFHRKVHCRLALLGDGALWGGTGLELLAFDAIFPARSDGRDFT